MMDWMNPTNVQVDMLTKKVAATQALLQESTNLHGELISEVKIYKSKLTEQVSIANRSV